MQSKNVNAVNRRFSSSNTDWWKEEKTVISLQTQTGEGPVSPQSINDCFYQAWGNKKQPDISRFISKTAHTEAPLLFTINNVEECLGKLKPCASGPDKIPPQILKCSRLELSDILTSLFNQCLQHSFVPSQWKAANITPILKITTLIEPAHY